MLGAKEGLGFKQLMRTFEGRSDSDRSTLHRGSLECVRFGVALCNGAAAIGKAIVQFPRVADKLALMIVELVMARRAHLLCGP